MAATLAACPPALAAVAPEEIRAGLIDRMLGPDVPAANRPQIVAAMRRLPLSVLRTLAANHTQVRVLPEYGSPLEAGIVAPLDLAQAYAHPDVLARQAHAALREADRVYGPRIRGLERQLAGMSGDDAEEARLELDSVRAERDGLARRAVQEATDGLVDPAVPSATGPLDAEDKPSAAEAANFHGARTRAEVGQYVALTARLNGSHGTTLLPAIEYYRPVERPDAPATILRTHDSVSDVTWRDGGVLGQYFYQNGRNVVAVSARAFDHDAEARHVVLHELGHAYEDAVRKLAPTEYAPFSAARDAAFTRIEGKCGHPFRFEHAGSSPHEMAVETFAVTYDGGIAPLRKADPQWTRDFEKLRAAGDAVGCR